MARIKLAINSYNKTEAPFRATQSMTAAQILPPRIGNESNLNRRIRDMRFKSKRLIPQFKINQVKQTEQVIREMIPRQKTIYPGKQNVQD